METINISYQSDPSILKMIGAFVKHHRLDQNKTQARLAHEAGINRSTLSAFEKGEKSTMDTFIRLLRVLNLLYLLESFQVQEQISPLKLAEMQMSMRKRASRSKPEIKKPKSGW
jgi:transcriptional regulator with XRE-family HTH domain